MWPAGRNSRFRGLIPLLALVLVGAGGGAAIGVGTAALMSEPQLDASGTTSTGTTSAKPARPDARTTPAKLPTGASRGRTTRVAVIATVLHPATSPPRQSLRRARLSVEVRVTNRHTSPIALALPRIEVAGESVSADMNATTVAGKLLGYIPAKESTRGVLRFETSGRVTDSLTSTLQASLRIAGSTIPLRVKLGDPAKPIR